MVQTQAIWQKTKSGGKTGFDKLWGWADKLGAPVNRLSNRLGSEAFWPTTLDKECDKAARILRSFCKDGFYQEEEHDTVDGPKQKQKVLKKIPAEVIKNAQGLAIFTTMRTGLWVSGAGGSGILVGKQSDGSWSPPSGIMLHTAGLGFLVGVDIYDCVVVINTQKALEAFSKVRCTLGGEISAVAGPVGVGGVLESEVHKRQAPIFTYLKSRGFYAGVQVDGTVIIERSDENERFYGERISVADILAGKARNPPFEIMKLMETIRAAQGDTNVDESLLTTEPPPGDFEIEQEKEHSFGIPDEEDPDPFGVIALEKQGLLIREAGTHKRPTSEQFEFKPSPTSPIYTTFRRSMDRSSIDSRTVSRRSSWRTSNLSTLVDRSTQVDMSTQTDLDPPPTIQAPPLPPRHENNSPKMAEIPENRSTDEEKDQNQTNTEVKKVEMLSIITTDIGEQHSSTDADKQPNHISSADTEEKSPYTTDSPKEEKCLSTDSEKYHTSNPTENYDTTAPTTHNSTDLDNVDLDPDSDASDAEEEEEEAIIAEVHQAVAPQAITRARVVTVAKPVAPKLPPRNPGRARLTVNSDLANESSTRDQGVGPSPMTSGPRSPSTPSLRNYGSSTDEGGSRDSVYSVDGAGSEEDKSIKQLGLEENSGFHSVPESPVKSVPGGFLVG